MALGPNQSYICIFDDGDMVWRPHNLVTDLTFVYDNDKDYTFSENRIWAKPVLASLGPAGERFLKFDNGYWIANWLEDACDERLAILDNQEGKDILDMKFGADGSWWIRYRE